MKHKLLALITMLLLSPFALAETIVITGGIVHTMTDDGVINGGTVIIEDGKITAVGRNLQVPEGARIFDATGKVVTPGFMMSHSTMGIEEISLEAASLDYGLDGERFTAAFSVADAINPRSILIPINRIEGITRVAVAPYYAAGPFSVELDGALMGQGAILHLGSTSDYLVNRNSGMYFLYGEDGAAISGGARGGALLRLREALDEARDYAVNRSAWEQGRRRDYRLHHYDLVALQPLLQRKIPLLVDVNRASDIEVMLRLASEYNLRLVIISGKEAWMVADQLAAANVPVIVDPLDNTPSSFDALAASLKNAAALDAAGVKIALMNDDTHNVRNVKQNAGNAVAHGLPWEAALRALTINPAEIFSIPNYGRLAAGFDADVVIWDGDPLEVTTYADQVFIKGRVIPMESRSTKLFERYRNLDFELPPAYRN